VHPPRAGSWIAIAAWCALLLVNPGTAQGAGIEPILKGAWPEYGPASAKGVAVDRDFAYGVAVGGPYVFLAAGNAGLEIFEASDPAHPRRLGQIDTATLALDIVVDGGYAYVVLEGRWNGATNVSGSGLDVIDVRDPANPKRVGGFETDGPVTAVVVVGNRAFVASMSNYQGPPWIWQGGGVDVLDLSDPAQPSRIGRFATSGPALALGYAGGLLCVLDSGAWTGWERAGAHVAVLDVATSSSPRKLGEYPLAGGGEVSKIVLVDHYAYFVLPYQGGLHVVDLTDPSRPRRVNPTFSLGGAMDLAVSGSRLFTASGAAGVKVIDITAPVEPRWLGGYGAGGYFQEFVFGSGYAVAPSYNSGLSVLDVSDPLQPRRAGFHTTQSGPNDIAIAGRFAYVAETGDLEDYQPVGGRLSVVDMAEPIHPRRVGVYELTGPALAVAVCGQRACLALGSQGLKLIDVSDPTAPQAVGDFDTGGYASDVASDGHYAFVADGSHGLQIIDLSNAPALHRIGGHPTGGEAVKIGVNGRHAYVWDHRLGLLAFDVSDPANPQLLDRLVQAPEGDRYGSGSVSFSGDYACVLDTSGLRVLDLRDPDQPRLIAIQSSVSPGSVAALQGGTVYLHTADSSTSMSLAELPPFFRSLTQVGTETRLEWEGWGRARLEGTRSLSHSDWQELGIPETTNRTSLLFPSTHGFFRLRRP
jgi:hypothetical protein